ncbi:CotH kinase family protein [Paraglaciecola sp.]|uniref:CotH kinase family protein n=1 Tax=Paraglaciecola sp. TaxID=1920173 RepID=UPI003EF7597E
MQTHLLFVALTLIGGTLLSACGGGSSDNSSNDTPGEVTPTEPSTPVVTTSKVVVNEIVAKASDDQTDWIELYVVDGEVNLSNYSLVDDSEGREAQALPDVTANAGDYVVVQAIDEEDTPPEEGYYVTFKLGSEDSVTLFENNVQVDQLAWTDGDAAEGSSYGLYTDGSGEAQTLMPTQGAANQLASEPVTLDQIVNENAELRINEVVAKDSAGGADWIEFYVTGTASVYLGDYSIKDEDSELVSLPEVTINSGEFYRVFATNDESELANIVAFKLGASDELSLFKADDLVDTLKWNKGQALIGHSYGRFPDGSDGTHILTPSVEAQNSQAEHGPLIINEVVASDIDGGNDWFELYNVGTGSLQLSDYQVIDESNDIDPVSLPDISLNPGEYVVIYATDEDPGDYYVPFKLGKTDELSLILQDETVDFIDWDDSDVIAGFSYGIQSTSDIANDWDKGFLSPTPGTENTLASAFDPQVVSNLSIAISDENWQNILNNPLDEEYHQAAISLNGVSLDSVAIRTKGGSSLRSVAQSASDRYSFKIDINEYVDGQKFFGLKKFTLQNSFNDPSYMREVIAYQLLDEMGVATPEHAYVNVYINEELFGFYLMVEAVDGEFLEKHFANENGDMYKPDGVGSDLNWLGDNIASYSDINLQTNEDTTDNGAFINFVEKLAQGSTDVIEVDSLLRYLSVSVALSNLDSFHGTLAHNYYIYEQDGVFSLLPWDLNEAFGSFAMGCRSDVRELYIDEPTMNALADRPLVANVFAHQAYLDTYHTYLWELINGPLTSVNFAARVAGIADLIREHVANDPSAFYGVSSFDTNLDSTSNRFFGLTEFINYRVDNMTKQLQGTLPSAGNGSGFCN